MTERQLEKTQEFTIFSDHEFTKNDNLSMHKECTPAEAV